MARLQSPLTTAVSVTSVTANWAQPTQPGSLLVMLIGWRGSMTVASVPAGWTLVDGAKNSGSTAIYCLPAASVRSSETVTFSASCSVAVALVEYSGMGGLDVSASKFGAHSEADTGTTVTTSQADQVWVGSIDNNVQTTIQSSPTGGFVELHQVGVGSGGSGHRFGVYELVVSAVGAAETSVTLSATRNFAGAVGTFNVASGGESYSGGSTATVTASATAAGVSARSGGSTAPLTATATGAGVAARTGGATATVTVTATGSGTAARSSGSTSTTSTTSVTTTGDGAAARAGGSAATVTVTPTGDGATARADGSTATVTVTATGAGSASTAGAGGSTATVTATATGAGTTSRTAGSTATVAVTPTGAGTTARTGAATATATVTATGGKLTAQRDITITLAAPVGRGPTTTLTHRAAHTLAAPTDRWDTAEPADRWQVDGPHLVRS